MSCGQDLCGGIKWVAEQVGIFGTCETAGRSGFAFTCADVVKGVQAFTYDASFETTPFFSLGQSEVYELREGIPSVSISMSKALDGYTTPYLLATKDARNPTLIGRAATKAVLGASVFPCDYDSARGTPTSTVVFSGVQVDSIAYNFGVEGAFTEDVTLRGNDMIWKSGTTVTAYTAGCGCTPSSRLTAEVATIAFTGCNAGNDRAPRTGMQFRENIIFGHDTSGSLDANGALKDPDTTILPPEIPGIRCSGTNDDGVCIQSISISAQLNREDRNCLGEKGPQTRTITLPVTVETAIEVDTNRDALIMGTTYGVCQYTGGFDDCVDDSRCATTGVNLKNRTIRVATCDGLRVYTGIRNKMSGFGRSGGGTDGSNVIVTYNYRTYNTLTVLHCQDTSSSGAAWWASRDQYLTD